MFTPRRLCASSFLILCLLYMVRAQDQQSGGVAPKTSQTNTTVTASATAERVRFTAPSNVVRMQLQIISESGQILFDVSSKGNVLDWSLQDSSGQRLQGSYLTVVTVKSLSGRVSERTGTVSVEEKRVELKPVETSGLMAVQQQVVGPVEENGALTILKADEGSAVTVVANDGKDGQIIRDHGALSFRLGDFFSGNDQEQMRLTEQGNLGIGIAKPKAKLDVAGTVRAREGFQFADGSNLNVNDKGALTLTNSNGTVSPNVSGTGTQNRLAKWTDNAGTLGDSIASDTGTGLQLTAAPSGMVDTNLIYLNATNGTIGMLAGSMPSYGAASGPFFAMRGNTYNMIASQRGMFTIAAGNVSSPAGDDGSVKFNTGNDLLRMVIRPSGNVGIGTPNPTSVLHVVGSQPPTVSSGNGTDSAPVLQVIGGQGGSTADSSANARGGIGGSIITRAGDAGGTGGIGGGGDGGLVTIQAGNGRGLGGHGGSLNILSGDGFSGGGNITIQAGGGTALGAIVLQPNFGNVGIGATFPNFKLSVVDSLNPLRVQANSAGTKVASFGGFGTFEIDSPGLMGGRFEVMENGNVGIGTSTPSAKFDVQGGADSDGTNDPKAIALSWHGGGFRHWIRTRHNSSAVSGNAIEFFTNTSPVANGSIAPGTGNQLVMSLNGDKVGIGTAAPNTKLQVTGGDVFVEAPDAGVILKSFGGNCFKLTVTDFGGLTVSSITCP